MELQLHTGDIGNYLKDHDIKPSYQRMKIFQYLLDNHVHPTVDTIYKALCPEIPTLSKTTVYNTLNLFVEKKVGSSYSNRRKWNKIWFNNSYSWTF